MYSEAQQFQSSPYDSTREPAVANMVSNNNRLVTFATPLLSLMTHIKHTVEHKNVGKLRSQLIEEIKNFEKKLHQANYPIRIIVAARYCICTAIDEAVLNQTWGAGSVWVEQSLLSIFHRETWGGERFYIILEEMAKESRKNIDFLEFCYLLLSLGFEGKFFDKNIAIREEVRNRIFYRIRHARTKPDKLLSRAWKDAKPFHDKRNKLKKLKRWAVTSFIIIAIFALIFNIKLHHHADGIVSNLNKIAQVSPVTTFSQVVHRPIIRRIAEDN